MKPIHLDCTTISDAWFQAIYNIWNNSYIQDIQRGSFEKTQQRIQYPGFSCYISHPWEDMIPHIPSYMKIPDPIDGGMNTVENYFANYLMDPILAENETYKYASRIHEIIPVTNTIAGEIVEGFHYENNITQLSSIIDMLKKTPLTNHAVIEIAQPKDITCCVGKDGKNDPPCLRLIDFKVIPVRCSSEEPGYGNCQVCDKNKFCNQDDEYFNTLTVSVYFRSWDLWAGFPTNLGGIELLKQYVAQECELRNGSMYAYSAGLHLYKYQEELAKIRTMKI